MGASAVSAQQILTPELLWKLGRVSALGISKDGKNVIYKVSVPSVEENKSDSKFYSISVNGGFATEIPETKELFRFEDGKFVLYNPIPFDIKTTNNSLEYAMTSSENLNITLIK